MGIHIMIHGGRVGNSRLSAGRFCLVFVACEEARARVKEMAAVSLLSDPVCPEAGLSAPRRARQQDGGSLRAASPSNFLTPFPRERLNRIPG